MYKGRVWKYGNDVNTDVIIPARYLTIIDPLGLAAHCMEDLDPSFVGKVREGDIIVAGANFGCGSSREAAPVAIKASGVAAVVAKSFARIFFRNAINIGLPIFESSSASDGIEEGDQVEINEGSGLITNRSRGISFRAAPFPEFLQQIVAVGGLVEYASRRHEA